MSDTRPGKLTAIALSKSMTVKELVIDALKKGKSQAGAARFLDVNVNTIRHHIKQNGLQIEHITSIEVTESVPEVADVYA